MKIVLNIAVTIWLTGLIGHSIYTKDIQVLEMSQEQLQVEWLLRIVKDVGLFLTASLAVIFSIINYGNGKYIVVDRIYMLGSILFCAFFIGVSAYGYKNIEYLNKELKTSILDDPERVKQYEGYLTTNNSFEVDDRIKFTQIIASNVFVSTGRKIKVVNKKVKIVEYIPSVEVLNKRKEIIYANKLSKWTLDSFKYAFIIWCGLLVLSISIGLSGKRYKNRNVR